MKRSSLLLLLFSSILMRSQSKGKLGKDLNPDDSTALLTIASYPDS